MKQWNARLFVLIVGLVVSPALAQTLPAGFPSETSAGNRGGIVRKSGGFQFELVFSTKSVQVYVFDGNGKPLDASQARGRVSFSSKGDRRRYRYDLYPGSREAGCSNCLHLSADLSRFPDRAATVVVAVYGLAQRRVEMSARFVLTQTEQQIAMRRQRVCPVSGKLLKSAASSVTLGDREIYVCCEKCSQDVKAKPDFYLAKLAVPLPQRSGSSDAAAIGKQETCPVTGALLRSSGRPWKVSVRGRDVFVCCQTCVAPLRKRPTQYLAKLPASSSAKPTKSR